MKLQCKVIFLLFLYSCNTSIAGNKDAIKNYQKTLRKFRKQMCTSKDSRLFWEYTKQTNRGGFYIPLTLSEKLDTNTIQKMLPAVRNKKQWINSNIEKIKSDDMLRSKASKIKNLQKDIKLLVGFKRRYHEETNPKQKVAIRKLSFRKLQDFYQRLRSAYNEIYFLHTYKFPADHKKMRQHYDSFKARQDEIGKKRANEIFFMRKLVEDGVRHPRWRGNDRSIRTLVNTTYIRSLENQRESFINEDMRYDLEWLLERISDYLEFDKSLIIKRLTRWERSTEKMYLFYLGILKGEVSIDDEKISLEKFLDGKGRSRQNLKDFVYKKQADVYEFWIKQNKLNRMLYVMDTIILNEVGGTTDPGDLEKEEVLKVVFNRSKLKFYSSIGPKDSIFKYIEARGISHQNFPWLNLMLKEGEFSFTYYFLTASNHVFCPDMSRRAQKIRETALDIGIRLLADKNIDTGAVRYFSRGSMLGRIDMTDLWSGFSSLPEKVGLRLTDKDIINSVKNRDYEFLYSFNDSSGLVYQTVRVGDENYVIDDKNFVYSYRNPHNFRYFVEK